MRRKLALIAAGLVAAGVMGAAAADVVDVAGTAYVDTSDNSVWQESNGEAGLQREADEDTAEPDTKLAG